MGALAPPRTADSKCARGRPLPQRLSRVSFWKILEILCANWDIFGKIAHCFDSKENAILTQTVGHK